MKDPSPLIPAKEAQTGNRFFIQGSHMCDGGGGGGLGGCHKTHPPPRKQENPARVTIQLNYIDFLWFFVYFYGFSTFSVFFYGFSSFSFIFGSYLL